MERGFLSQEGSRGGRGIKEKNVNALNLEVVKDGAVPSVVDMMVEMEKLSSLEDTTVLGSFPLLSTLVTTTAGNAPGKSSYDNVTGKPSGKKLNIHTLFTPGSNGIDVVVPVESIRAISKRYANNKDCLFLGKLWHTHLLLELVSSIGLFSFQFSSMDVIDAMLENGPWFIQNNPLILKKWHPDENLLKEDVSTVLVWVKLIGVPVTAFSEDGLSAIVAKLGSPLMIDSYTSDMCMQSWVRSSYTRAMIELRADVELKDNIVVAMPKIKGECHYICNVRVEYEWKPPRCTSCKVFGHIHEKCPKNTGASEKKTLKKPSQTSRGVSVGPKMGFKPQKEYRHVLKKPNASSSGNKKKRVEPTIEVSNANPFEVLNSIDNDVDTTPIIDKIRKFEELLTSGQAILVDEAGNPLKKVEYPGDYESEDEVASVDNDMAHSMASERVGFGTQSLLEQWRDSYGNGDYDEDPYDDDMYEVQALPQEIRAIYDNLDIRVRGLKLASSLESSWSSIRPDGVRALLRPYESSGKKDFLNGVKELRVADLFLKDGDESMLIDGVKTLPDVEFQKPARGRTTVSGLNFDPYTFLLESSFNGRRCGTHPHPLCKTIQSYVIGYYLFLCGSLVSWKSKKHTTVFKSYSEAEYKAIAGVACEIV
ncbi:retrotransposon protein, putative, ty1-copia subclass [Tanacetum coccineum]